MAAGTFYFTNPEAARQAIAEMQVGAAAAENQSRERIAKEQTQQQRYATASQIADRDKDRAVAGEDIASRGNYRTDAASRERGNIQYSTIRDSITEFDPPTKRELEATMAMSPQLTDDLKNDLRALRDRAYKIAKANSAMGAQAAKNYTSELGVKGMLDEAKAKIYERMAKDPNIIFDRASGRVESAFRPPREDTSGASVGPPTIEEIRAKVGNQSTRGLLAPPPTASMLGSAPAVTVPPPIVSAPIVEAGPTRGSLDLAGRMPAGSAGYDAYALMNPRPAVPRAADIAAPPPMQAGPMFTVPTEFMPPSGGADPADNRLFQILSKMPEFAALPPAGKQMVLDQVTGGLMAMPEPPPRVSDFQTLRPEFVPMDERYVAPQ